MNAKFLTRIREMKHEEDGVTIVEVLVAFTMIISVLLATALVMGAALTAQGTGEARDRAVQIARSYIEQARQVSYSDLGVTKAQSEMSVLEGGLGETTEYLGEEIVVLPDGHSTDLTFTPYQEVVVGQNQYEVWTYITKVNPVSFDGTLNHLGPNEIYPKRITVIVTWDSSETDKKQEVVQTWIRQPNIAECIPTYVLDPDSPGNAPIGCRTS